MEIVRELVPAKARQVIYAAYVVGGLIIGVLSIALPGEWTRIATDIMSYLAVPLAVLAGVNVPDNTVSDDVYEPKHAVETDTYQ